VKSVQKLVAVGLRIVGSVITDMSTPFRASELLMKMVTVRVPPAVSWKFSGALGQLVAVEDETIHTVPTN